MTRREASLKATDTTAPARNSDQRPVRQIAVVRGQTHEWRLRMGFDRRPRRSRRTRSQVSEGDHPQSERRRAGQASANPPVPPPPTQFAKGTSSTSHAGPRGPINRVHPVLFAVSPHLRKTRGSHADGCNSRTISCRGPIGFRPFARRCQVARAALCFCWQCWNFLRSTISRHRGGSAASASATRWTFSR